MPSIKHVYYSDGSHCLEVNGTRGPRAMYDHIAVHPTGYLAVTDYYAGGDGSFVPPGGMVWAVHRVSEYQEHSTVSKEEEERAFAMPMAEAMRLFMDCNERYESSIPEA